MATPPYPHTEGHHQTYLLMKLNHAQQICFKNMPPEWSHNIFSSVLKVDIFNHNVNSQYVRCDQRRCNRVHVQEWGESHILGLFPLVSSLRYIITPKPLFGVIPCWWLPTPPTSCRLSYTIPHIFVFKICPQSDLNSTINSLLLLLLKVDIFNHNVNSQYVKCDRRRCNRVHVTNGGNPTSWFCYPLSIVMLCNNTKTLIWCDPYSGLLPHPTHFQKVITQ